MRTAGNAQDAGVHAPRENTGSKTPGDAGIMQTPRNAGTRARHGAGDEFVVVGMKV
jgi:hypothetical protein